MPLHFQPKAWPPQNPRTQASHGIPRFNSCRKEANLSDLNTVQKKWGAEVLVTW